MTPAGEWIGFREDWIAKRVEEKHKADASWTAGIRAIGHWIGWFLVKDSVQPLWLQVLDEMAAMEQKSKDQR